MIFQKLRRWVQLFGVMLVVGFSCRIAPAQTSFEVAKVALQPGEIALEGRVLRNDIISNKFTLVLNVKAFWLPNGRGQKLRAPRERTIVLTQEVVTREVIAHERIFYPSFIGMGMTVLVVGHDGGSGSALLAREVVSLNYVRTTPPFAARLAAPIEYSKLKLWKEYKKPEHPIFHPAFSPDGRLVATGGHGNVGLLNVMTGDSRILSLKDILPESRRLFGNPYYLRGDSRSDVNYMVGDLQFSPDSKSLYISAGLPLISVVNVQSGHVTRVIPTEGDAHFDVAWDEKTLVEGLGGDCINVRDLTNDTMLRRLFTANDSIKSVVFSRDHKSIIDVGVDTAGLDVQKISANDALPGAVEIWDTWSGKLEQSTRIEGIHEETTKLSPNGKYVVGGLAGSFRESQIVRVWDVAGQRACGLFALKYPAPAQGFIADLDVSQDEKTLAVLSTAYRNAKATYPTIFPFQSLDWGKLQLWKLPADGTANITEATPPLFSAKINFFARRALFSPDGRTLVLTGTRRIAGQKPAGKEDLIIQVWRVPSPVSSTRIVARAIRKRRK